MRRPYRKVLDRLLVIGFGDHGSHLSVHVVANSAHRRHRGRFGRSSSVGLRLVEIPVHSPNFVNLWLRGSGVRVGVELVHECAHSSMVFAGQSRVAGLVAVQSSDVCRELIAASVRHRNPRVRSESFPVEYHCTVLGLVRPVAAFLLFILFRLSQ